MNMENHNANLVITGKYLLTQDTNQSIISSIKWTVERDKNEQGGTAIDADGNIYLGSEGENKMIAYGKMGNEL